MRKVSIQVQHKLGCTATNCVVGGGGGVMVDVNEEVKFLWKLKKK